MFEIVRAIKSPSDKESISGCRVLRNGTLHKHLTKSVDK